MNAFAHQLDVIEQMSPLGVRGRVSSVTGLSIAVSDFFAPIGAMCRVSRRRRESLEAQVVGFRGEHTVLMPLAEPLGVVQGDEVEMVGELQQVEVGKEMLGRVLDGRGRPIDGKGELLEDGWAPLIAPAPQAMERARINEPLSLGVRSIDTFLTVGRGQRIGLFAGTGVGKSVLMGMIARNTEADATVVALVGERGREVGEFLARDLGEEGLRKSVVVVSTSDQSPVLRVRACYVATAVAEYFRSQGKHVLLLMDSLTRVAMAQRQIGLSAGEPPTTKGYPPSVFSLLPQLLGRPGRTPCGSITGIYTVLVEGDDITEPVADAVRGVLDGHIWLSRALAERGHYPAIDVLGSISRVMTDVVDRRHREAAIALRRILATWQDIADLVNIGAYVPGTTVEFDLAVEMKPKVDAFLQQTVGTSVSFVQAKEALLSLADQAASVERRLRGTANRPARAKAK
jgi:flagellum-specific ATP synthase